MIDYSTPAGQVRLLIPDIDEEHLILDGAQIDAFLRMEGGNVKLAAAQALDAIASSEALIAKAISTGDLQTNGPAVAQELRARAAELRRQVAEGDSDDAVGLQIVDFDPHAAYRTLS